MTRLSDQRLEARLFAIGSALFAIGAVLTEIAALPTEAGGISFFVGSIFFTVAAGVQLFLSGRPHSAAVDRAGWSDWWSAAIQFAGTICFNVSTFAALHLWAGDAARAHVWLPDVYGSIAFLVSSALAVHACTLRDRLWDPAARSWRVAWLNMFGSLAFGASAWAARIVLDTNVVANARLDTAGTFFGALGFLFAALLMSPASRT